MIVWRRKNINRTFLQSKTLGKKSKSREREEHRERHRNVTQPGEREEWIIRVKEVGVGGVGGESDSR